MEPNEQVGGSEVQEIGSILKAMLDKSPDFILRNKSEAIQIYSGE